MTDQERLDAIIKAENARDVDQPRAEIYYHGDEVSGMTVFADGTRAHWTEGRSSDVHFFFPDGTLVVRGAWDTNPLVQHIDTVHGEARGHEMTEEQEQEHDKIMDKAPIAGSYKLVDGKLIKTSP